MTRPRLIVFLIGMLVLPQLYGQRDSIHHEKQLKGLMVALNDPLDEVKVAALRRLNNTSWRGKIPDEELSIIADIVSKDSSGFCIAAIRALSNNKNLAPKYLDIIAERFDDKDLEVAVAAIYAFRSQDKLDSVYLNRIAELFDHENHEIATTAISVIGFQKELNSKYWDKIAQQLNNENSKVIGEALDVLRRNEDLDPQYLSKVFELFKGKNYSISSSAAAIIGKQMGSSAEYLDSLYNKLNTSDSELKRASLYAFSFQKNLDPKYIESIYKVINQFSKEPAIISKAISALGEQENLKGKYLSKIIDFLDHYNYDVRNEAAIAISNQGKLKPQNFKKVFDKLREENYSIRIPILRAFGTVINLDSIYIEEIAKQLNEKNSEILLAVLYALEIQMDWGNLDSTHIAAITEKLNHPDSTIFWAAFSCLSYQKNLLAEHADKIAEKLNNKAQEKNPNMLERQNVITAFRILGEKENLANEYIAMLASHLDNTDYSFMNSTIFFLGKQKNLDYKYIIKITELLKKPYSENVDDVWNVIRREPLNHLIKYFPIIIEGADFISNNYGRNSALSSFRVPMYELSGGEDSILYLLKWFCIPGDFPNEVSLSEAKSTLNTIAIYLDSLNTTPAFKKEVIKMLPELIAGASVPWEKQDADSLQVFLDFLEANNSEGAAAVKNVINDLTRKIWLSYILTFFLIQVGLWLLLFLLYPKSIDVQQYFFWNPKVRSWLGLGYIGLLISNVPWIRKRLFLPFKKGLIEDADPKYWDNETYFPDSTISEVKGQSGISLKDAFSELKGQNLLIGESGLGKSMYLRYWAVQSKRITAFLPASICTEGVIPAIRSKLPNHIEDTEFLEKLIYRGGIDLLIDGLNEISAQARANIIAELKQNFKGNLILTCQPMDWEVPSNVKTWYLNPLTEDQTFAFLSTRYESIDQQDIVPKSAYQEASKAYLESVYSSDLPAVTLINYRNVLSNPMDLSSIAQLIARGQKPDLFQLREQQFNLMAEDYEEKNLNQKFPLEDFSKAAFDMRLKDQREIPAKEFGQELRIMSRWKMVLSRQSITADGNTTENWYFRHDKIWDYFLVQEFLAHPDLQETYIDDARFRTVYFLLAFYLKYDDAMNLRERLIQHAADTRNHSVSDNFIQIIRGKKEPDKTDREKWIDAIKGTIAANQPEAAFLILKSKIRSNDDVHQKEVVLLEGRLNELEHTSRKGTEEESTLRRERTKILDSILDLSNSVYKNGAKSSRNGR